MGVHHTLGVARRTRGKEHGRHIGRTNLLDLFLEEVHMDGCKCLACSLQLIYRSQAGFIVVAQATGVIKEDVFQLGAALANLHQLVNLLLVFSKGEAHFSVIDRENALCRGRILVQGNRNSAQRLHCQHGGIQAGTVGPHHNHVVSAAQASLVQSGSQLLNHGGQVNPAQGLPNTVFLLAHGGLAWAAAGMLQ